MRKINIIMCFALILVCLFGCNKNSVNNIDTVKNDNISVVTTVYPVYDWIRNIGGDKVNVSYLLDNGVDLHNYQPTSEDIIKITTADIFIYIGGESDEWVEDLFDSGNSDTKVVNLMENMNDYLLVEETKEGMMSEEESDEEKEEEIEYDEHIWLSLNNAIKCTEIIRDVLIDVDQKNENTYTDNAEYYIKQLSDLNDKYADIFNNIPDKCVIFGDRFPFRYLCNDYNIDYFAAFKGCDASSEASFETIVFLSNKLNELNIDNIFILEGNNGYIANSVIEGANKDVNIITINSLQSVSEDLDYIEVMDSNLNAIVSSLED